MSTCTQCDSRAVARGLCDRDYRRAKRNGTLDDHAPTGHRVRPVTRRAAEHPPGTPLRTRCVLTQGRVDSQGYGRRTDGSLVHRWVVEQAGADSSGRDWDPALHVLHLCDNPPCFRYDHLRLGTHHDNMADMVAKERSRSYTRSEHPQTKLGDDACGKIIDLYRGGGVSQRALARRYGVHQRTVGRIIKFWTKPDNTPMETDS